MNKNLIPLVIIGFLALGCVPAAALTPTAAVMVPLKYRDLTGTLQLDIQMSEQVIPGGFMEHSVQSDGDLHDVQLDSAAATVRYDVDSPSRQIKYTVTRLGNVLTFKGILAGAGLSKDIKISGLPWYEAIERSLHDYVLTYAATGVKTPLTFWVVHPWEAKTYQLQAVAEIQEQITVNGRSVTGVRVRVSPTGLLRLVWSSLYWYRPSDGLYLRYEAVRGGPGTPKSVVEFMGKS
jgi:hypothetical protein